MTRTRRLAVLLGALALAGPPVAALDAPAAHAVPSLPDSGYRLRELQIPSGSSAEVSDINERGEVAGEVVPAAGFGRPAVWDAAGKLHLLPAPAHGGAADALDDRGRVVGSILLDDWRQQAVIWRDGGRPVPVGPQDDDSVARLVNRAGQVAGGFRANHSLVFLDAAGRSTRPLVVSGAPTASGWLAADLDDAGNLYSKAFFDWPGMEDPPPATVWRLTPGGREVDALAGLRPLGIVPAGVHDVTVAESGVLAVSLTTRGWPAENVTLAVPPGRAPVVVSRFPAQGDGAPPEVVADDRGRVVAQAEASTENCPAGPAYRMLGWDPTSGTRSLPSSGSPCGEVPVATDDAGEIAGILRPTGFEEPTATPVPFVWDSAHGYRRLAAAGWIQTMNQAGSVVGAVSDESTGRTRTMVWDPPEGHLIVTRTASADTWVAASATRSLGASPSLTAGGGAQALLRFAVPAAPSGRRLVAASVRFTVTTEAGAGTALPLEVRPVAGSSSGAWSESTTWASRPAVDRRRLGWLGAVAAGEPVSVRIDPADVPAGGVLDVAVVGTSADVVKLASREAASASARPSVELIYR